MIMTRMQSPMNKNYFVTGATRLANVSFTIFIPWNSNEFFTGKLQNL